MADMNTDRVLVRRDDPLAHIDGAVIDRHATELVGGSIIRDYWRLGAPATILISKPRGGRFGAGSLEDGMLVEIAFACSAAQVDGGTGERDELLFYAPVFVAELVGHLIDTNGPYGVEPLQRSAHVVGDADFEKIAEAMAALHAAERAGGGIWAWKESWSLDAARRIVDICADAGCTPAALLQVAPPGLLRRWNDDRLLSLIPLARTAFAPAGATP